MEYVGNEPKDEVVLEEEHSNNQIDWTKLLSEWKSYQTPWKVRTLKEFGQDFGLALFFLILSSYALIGDTLVANSFFSGNDYIRDVKNRQENIEPLCIKSNIVITQ